MTTRALGNGADMEIDIELSYPEHIAFHASLFTDVIHARNQNRNHQS